MSKHTPGPWITDDVHKGDTIRFVMSDLRPFPHTIAKLELGQDRETQEANARLIAAAPDLRVVLQRLVEHDEYMIEMGTLHSFIEVEKARALLDSLPDEANA